MATEPEAAIAEAYQRTGERIAAGELIDDGDAEGWWPPSKQLNVRLFPGYCSVGFSVAESAGTG